ncbi:MAG: class I SAM-dependent methyltransferase [Polyangiaceae bacterium]
MAQEPTNIWETVFADKQMMWGTQPTLSAVFAKDYFLRMGARAVLVPGIGYGRNAKLFVDQGMSVTGIEISETAIALSRSQMGLDIPIHHGAVQDMPFDTREYDGIFCYGLIYLLDANGRAKLARDCWAQLAPGGTMIFTVISKRAPMYGQGPRLDDDWYEDPPRHEDVLLRYRLGAARIRWLRARRSLRHRGAVARRRLVSFHQRCVQETLAQPQAAKWNELAESCT